MKIVNKPPETLRLTHRGVADYQKPGAISCPAVPALQKKDDGEESSFQSKEDALFPAVNRTGMPDNLKAGIENLSGISLDDVKVHYNSDKPAQLSALAYAQGTEIHVAPGQERYLPHEAWHVVQQKQGRVRPTMQMKEVAINDDKGLEKEADVMGGTAIQQTSVSSVKKGTSSAYISTSIPIQRVSKIYVGKNEVAENSKQGTLIFKLINELTRGFTGEVWFNSGLELQNWIRSIGKVEGIGVWNGRWMNFTGKGPIVFGEEHNDIRMDFINTLKIQHFVVEGAFERSLTGVDDSDIPHHPHSAHQKYTGDTNGKALENFWVRSAQGMARFWINFENELRNINPESDYLWLKPIERLSELEEIIRTIPLVRAKVDDKTEAEKHINEQILNAQFYLEKAFDVGLGKLLEQMKKGSRDYKISLPRVLKEINARGKGLHYLYVCFSGFRKAIEEIGYLHFSASASEEELFQDQYTKDSSDPFKVWGGRREHFMLKNLEAALSQSPPPLITTMGVAHAKNQQHNLEALLHNHNGMLIMGSIVDLADIGAVKMFQVSEDISKELAGIYGWSESYRKEFAENEEALSSAKIRISNTKKPAPSYIS